MQIRSIQALRAIAACAVVLVHAHNRILAHWPELSPHLSEAQVHVGHAGVDLFFVLSGFLMAYLHQDMFGSPGAPKIFFTRRLIRIVPIYWLLSGLALILTIAVPQAFATGRLLELPYLLGDFAFIPWPNSQGSFERLLVVGWTLDYEMYFYVLFSLALFLRSGLKWLIGFLLASVIAGLFSHPAHPWLQLLMSPMLGEFLLGIFVAQLVRHPVSRWAAWTLLVLGCVAVACSGLWRVDRAFEWGIPAAVIVLAVLWLNIECRGPVGRAMVVLGDASYSIYLTQVFSLPALVIVMKMVGLRLPADLQLFVLWAGATLAGVAFWWSVEKRITEWLKGALQRRRRKEVPAMAS